MIFRKLIYLERKGNFKRAVIMFQEQVSYKFVL